MKEKIKEFLTKRLGASTLDAVSTGINEPLEDVLLDFISSLQQDIDTVNEINTLAKEYCHSEESQDDTRTDLFIAGFNMALSRQLTMPMVSDEDIYQASVKDNPIFRFNCG